jgi:hypothetical protein
VPDQIPDSHTVVLRAAARGDADINVMVNAYWDNLIFTIQAPGSGSWIHRWQPFDIVDVTTAPSERYTICGGDPLDCRSCDPKPDVRSASGALLRTWAACGVTSATVSMRVRPAL